MLEGPEALEPILSIVHASWLVAVRLPEDLAPAVLDIISETEALITVTEGRYHQVRRMFAATGNFVEALRRERLGDLCLHENLAPGRWNLLSEEETALVFR